MPYVQRKGGAIIGLYARPQPGYAEEFVSDDAPELAAYLAPPPERRLVPKYVIVDRLQAVGKLEAAYSRLEAQDRYTRERWASRTAIYADDPTAVALLKAIGADPNEILANG